MTKNKNFKKQVYCYDETGQLKATYPSLGQGSLAILGTNKGTGNITMCCKERLHTCYGLVWSYTPLTEEEVKNRYIIASKFKKINQYDLDMNYIASYPSAKEASRQTGIETSLISGVCCGRTRQTYGFIFKYAK